MDDNWGTPQIPSYHPFIDWDFPAQTLHFWVPSLGNLHFWLSGVWIRQAAVDGIDTPFPS